MSQTNLFYIAAGIFFATGLIYLFSAESSQGATFVALGTTFLAIGASYRKSSSAFTKPVELSEPQKREVQALVAEGKKIEAIKRVREETGAGLKTAKEYVDQLEPQATK